MARSGATSGCTAAGAGLTREYHANVERILDGRPYRGATLCGFWQVHKELAEATKDGRLIVLTILENTAPEDLNHREQTLICEGGATLNGGLPTSIVGV